MARIIKPSDIAGYHKLAIDIKTKDGADGINSIIKSFLLRKKYVINDIVNNLETGKNLEAAHTQMEADAELLNSQTYGLFDPCMVAMRGGGKYLKAYFSENSRLLGDWALTVNKKSEIVYPPDFIHAQIMFIQFCEKHESFTDPLIPSPLKVWLNQDPVNVVDLAQLKLDAVSALAKYEAFDKKSKEKEKTRKERDRISKPEMKKVDDICNFIVQANSLNPNKASDWGIEIDTSPQAPVEKEYIIANGKSKTMTNLKLGSTIKNTGNTVLLITKGKTAEGESKALNPGEEKTIKRGEGTSTVTNTGQIIMVPPMPPKTDPNSPTVALGRVKVIMTT